MGIDWPVKPVRRALQSLNCDGRLGLALLAACALLLLPTLAGEAGRGLLRYDRVALAVKLAYEHWLGALPFSGSDPVVVSAHLYGVTGGATVAAFLKPHRTPL